VKQRVKPAQKRAVVRYFRVGFRVSERRACRLVGVARSSYRYRSQAADQTALRLRLRDLAAARVRYGYRRLHILLRREGWRVNHKRVYRLYREEELGIRVKRRKKLASAPRVLPPPARRPHERWSLDFLADSLADGRRFRVLTRVDTVSRVSPAIEIGVSLTGERVVAVLERLKRTLGRPSASPSTTGRRSSPGPSMPGPTGMGCNWSSRGPANPPTTPSSSRSTDGSETSA
jgi:putative transposase